LHQNSPKVRLLLEETDDSFQKKVAADF